ncbi:MAG: sulfatase-like hydrolase/transferase [Candidatus Amulumruptor caecigallinarius]|nr:sulfatase-like hydrolase/transferase [Candidatus Amulumruptor caecigallinarius]MCM1397000.1 sulfatase-like hydrolase/transferase [Candidatus Amulumruptor caecigallinarius]MCM1454642.1 sulfatase-like hydrolase/transferase [bacterium]
MLRFYLRTAGQWLLALLLLWLTRIPFTLYNGAGLDVASVGEYLRLSMLGLRFDVTATSYFLAPFILLRILPFRAMRRRVWLRVSDWLWYLGTALMLIISAADIPYFRFTGARLRLSIIDATMADATGGGIVGAYLAEYWWLVLATTALMCLAVWVFRLLEPRECLNSDPKCRKSCDDPLWVRIVAFLLLGGLTFLGMRGRTGSGNPLSIPDATFGIRTAPQINVVLNSPFTLIRSGNAGKSNSEQVLTFFTAEELAGLRESLHTPAAGTELRRKNVMQIIIESGGSNFIDGLNVVPGDEPRHLMPFLDTLSRRSLTVLHCIAISRASCGGATAVMGGFPAFDPFYFIRSPYNSNRLDSPAWLLGKKGWDTAFYYGCNHGSFSIDQMAAAAGYRRIRSREDYGDDSDYDGVWGIFDEPMGQYVVRELGELNQPWIATWFTVSAHSPFTLPDGYDTSRFRRPERSPERGLEYTDLALRRFFDEAAKQPWYRNTIFIITGDHGNREFLGTKYDTPWIHGHVPYIVYTPDGSIEPRLITDRVMAQHDAAATLLSLIGYPDSYVQIGTDILDDTQPHYGIVRIAGRYFVFSPQHGIVVSADGETVDGVFDLVTDPELKAPLEHPWPAETEDMHRWTRAFLQDYTHRLTEDRMSVESPGAVLPLRSE